MTRETKIGLLVGLAFIIVIGILLSDHLTSATEPPQAQLAQVGNNVRSTTNAPGTNRSGNGVGNGTSAGIFNNATNQQPVAPTYAPPTHAVPTQNELANRTAAPVQIINVGGPAQNQNPQQNSPTDPPVSMAPPVQQPVQQPEQPIVMNQPVPQLPNVNNDPVMPGSIADVARRNGEELVGPNNEPVAPPVINTVVPTSTGTASYVAVSGDNLSKIARKTFGSDSKANRDAIINANPSLKADANKIISGRTYVIPVKKTVTPVTAPEATPERTPPKPATAATEEHWYTVQTGDSLWRIAETQCGGGKAVAAIKELNKDIIKNDVVQAGQKIRLPNAPAKQG